jgi:peroxiredoxin family protein
MIEWGLKRLYNNLKSFDYSAMNLLSCMTLDIENCHSTVHTKQANMSKMEYRSFGLAMKEAVKRVTGRHIITQVENLGTQSQRKHLNIQNCQQ